MDFVCSLKCRHNPGLSAYLISRLIATRGIVADVQFDSCENYGLRDSSFGRAIIISKRADQLIFVAGDLERYVDVNGVLTA